MKRIEWFYDEENYGYSMNSILKIIINGEIVSLDLYRDSCEIYKNFI